jgi:DHA1 family tetracycline resistance protein-like MFS transporter
VGASLAFAGASLVIGQGLLARPLIPALGGERRAAIVGLLVAAAAYVGYATATAGWMVYAWMLTWLVVCLAYPSMNALMSRQIPPSAQGELQGGVASIYSLSSIVGPPIMTQLFGYFSSARAPFRFPGAAFAASALMALASVALLVFGTGSEPTPPIAPPSPD